MTPRLYRQRLTAALLITLILGATACRGAADPDPAPAPTSLPGGLTTATPTPEATIDQSLEGEDRDVAVWGAKVCALARTFAADFLASGDPRDPADLPLAERKARATVIFPGQFGAVGAALDQLGLIDPPERTADLHDLLRQTYEGLRDALRDQQVIIEASTSTDDIAFSNVEVNEWINLAFRQAELLQNAGYC